ncbi:MAG: response regulator, partial [Spirulina sp. SIO3F2]|nr:response regulator [Spirulina sp. SIO3F2]
MKFSIAAPKGLNPWLVDDNPDNLLVISETLRNVGYTVATAIDGERAINRLQSHQPDL